MRTRCLYLILLAALAGCGRPEVPPPAPLSSAEWKALPAEQRYSAENLERLKAGDPALGTPEGWERFSRTTLVEARRQDRAGRRR